MQKEAVLEVTNKKYKSGNTGGKSVDGEPNAKCWLHGTKKDETNASELTVLEMGKEKLSLVPFKRQKIWTKRKK